MIPAILVNVSVDWSKKPPLLIFTVLLCTVWQNVMWWNFVWPNVLWPNVVHLKRICCTGNYNCEWYFIEGWLQWQVQCFKLNYNYSLMYCFTLIVINTNCTIKIEPNAVHDMVLWRRWCCMMSAQSDTAEVSWALYSYSDLIQNWWIKSIKWSNLKWTAFLRVLLNNLINNAW